MLAFAVQVKDVTKEGQATWVLDIDPVGERFLIVHEDKTMHWHPMADCTFVKLVSPDAPTPVVPVQTNQPRPPLSLADMGMPNRAMRRANGN